MYPVIHGTGLGLRGPHVPQVAVERPNIPWFEVLVDNYLGQDNPMRIQLEKVRNDYPLTFHCVGMSLGSMDPLDKSYLQELAELASCYEPALLSDHVSFSSFAGEHFHDLLPLPYTEESLEHLASRVSQVQDVLKRQILLENPSTYIRFTHSTMAEAEFLNALAERSGCGLLLDINNVYVNAFNHGESAEHFLREIDLNHVQQVHLGGYEQRDDYLLDAHNNPVSEPVWQLYAQFIRSAPSMPVLIEWDNDLPNLDRLLQEQRKAESLRPLICATGT